MCASNPLSPALTRAHFQNLHTWVPSACHVLLARAYFWSMQYACSWHVS
jgi:hypothetical protein